MSDLTHISSKGYGYTYKGDGTLVPPSLPWRGDDIPEPRIEQISAANSDTQSIYWSIRTRISVRSFLTGSNFTNSTGQYSQPGAQWREALVLTMNGGFGQGAPRDGNYRPVIEGRDATPRRLSKPGGTGRTGRAPRAVPQSMLRALGLVNGDEYPQHQLTADSATGLEIIGEDDESDSHQKQPSSSMPPLLPVLDDLGSFLEDTWYDVEAEPGVELDEAISSVQDTERWSRMHDIADIVAAATWRYTDDWPYWKAVELEKQVEELIVLARPPYSFMAEHLDVWMAIQGELDILRSKCRGEKHPQTGNSVKWRLATLRKAQDILLTVPEYALEVIFSLHESGCIEF